MGGAEENSDIRQNPADDKPRQLQIISDERRNFIQQSLDAWCENQGYKDCNVNMLTLSHTLHLEERTESVLRPVSAFQFQNMAQRNPFQCSQEDDAGESRLQQRYHFCRVRIFLSHPSLPHLQDQGRVLAYRMEKIYQKGVAFLGMLLLFGRNATLFQGNATPFFSEKH